MKGPWTLTDEPWPQNLHNLRKSRISKRNFGEDLVLRMYQKPEALNQTNSSLQQTSPSKAVSTKGYTLSTAQLPRPLCQMNIWWRDRSKDGGVKWVCCCYCCCCYVESCCCCFHYFFYFIGGTTMAEGKHRRTEKWVGWVFMMWNSEDWIKLHWKWS